MRSFHLLSCTLLTLSLLLVAFPAVAQKTSASQDLEQKLVALNKADGRTAFSVGQEVASANSEVGFAVVRAVWPRLTNANARKQLLKAFYYLSPDLEHKRKHPHILAILHLGATDPDKSVQQFAFTYIQEVSLQNFSRDTDAYAEWYALYGALPPKEAESRTRISLIKAVVRAAEQERDPLVDRWRQIGFDRVLNVNDPALVTALRALDMFKVIKGWLASPGLNNKTVELAGLFFDILKPDDTYLAGVLRPLLEREELDPSACSELIRFLSRHNFSWTLDSLISLLKRKIVSDDPNERGYLYPLAVAISSIGGPRTIPLLIGAIQYDDTYDTIYAIGSFGLNKLTGVHYSSRHDGAWWGKWWERNKTRFPAEIQRLPIADLRPPDDPFTAARARTDKRIAWLKDNAIRIRSIDPNDEDYTDLLPLVSQIGNARIVLLGEQSHGDGATFAAKCRLVRFLHEKMGFDVLAWESGLFDCAEMEKALRSDRPLQEAIDRGIFPIWGASPLVSQVFEYARETYATPHSLEMAGFDCQFSTRDSAVRFRTALGEFLKKSPVTLIDERQRKSIESLVSEIQGAYKPAPESRSAYRGALEALSASIMRNETALGKALGVREVAFMRQTLKSLLAYEASSAKPRANRAEDNNLRDRAMADNLAWLVNTRYAGKKIIVWAASFHIARNLPTVKSPSLSYAKLVTMGQGVHDTFKSQVYTIGFTAYEGRIGNPFSDSTTLPRAGEDSMEALFHFAGAPISFVDFRSLPADHWLRKPLRARPLGYSPMEANWPNVFDAMIFTDRMFPADGGGKLPATYRTALTKTMRFEQEIETLLDEIWQMSWSWSHNNNKVFPAPDWYDPKRSENGIEEWPDILNFDPGRMSEPAKYRVLPGNGKGYTKEEGGFLIREPLQAVLSPTNYVTLLLTGGIAATGGVDSATHTMIYAIGEMAGKIHLESFATVLLKGDMKGSLATESIFTGLITGDLAGTFEARSVGILYVKGRVTGSVRLAEGSFQLALFKLCIGGRTTRKDLERIQGPGKVWLVDTDLPPGVHTIGTLTVTVEPRKP